MAEALIVFMTLSIPLSGIFAYAYLKAKKIQLEREKSSDKVLQLVLAENAEMKRRLENIEVIVSDGTPAQLSRDSNPDLFQQQIYHLANELKHVRGR